MIYANLYKFTTSVCAHLHVLVYLLLYVYAKTSLLLKHHFCQFVLEYSMHLPLYTLSLLFYILINHMRFTPEGISQLPCTFTRSNHHFYSSITSIAPACARVTT